MKILGILLVAGSMLAQFSTVNSQDVDCTTAGKYIPRDGVTWNSESWTGFVISYENPTSPAEIRRCVDQLTTSKPTQRFLQAFVEDVRRHRYQGVAHQWEVWVEGKLVCFLGVPK